MSDSEQNKKVGVKGNPYPEEERKRRMREASKRYHQRHKEQLREARRRKYLEKKRMLEEYKTIKSIMSN